MPRSSPVRSAELEALGEISQAVSSSLDVSEVLKTIVTDAVRLSGAEGGSIFEFDAETELFHVRTAYGTSVELVEALRRTRIGLRDTLVGEAAASGEARQVPEIMPARLDAHLSVLHAAGLAVDADCPSSPRRGDSGRARG